MLGWSINLTISGLDVEIDLPTAPLFVTTEGPVIEVVFWSKKINRWIHAVLDYFQRNLPQKHMQITLGDALWIEGVVLRYGQSALERCIFELDRFPFPRVEN